MGNVIKNGVPVAIIGRPNAGKSTLLNAILKEDRAIVSNIAGTTRDTIEEKIIINGIEFRFVDTAGIRQTDDEIEKIGVERALAELNKSTIYIYLFDVSQLSVEDVKQDLLTFGNSVKNIIVANKMDLASQENINNFKNSDLKPIFISAKEQHKIEELKSELVEKLNLDQINQNQTIVTNARHYEALSKSLNAIKKVEEGLNLQIPGDLLAMDIREILDHLGQITGSVSSDELLGNIFANFCIGK